MDIFKATLRYEKWLEKRMPLIAEDLHLKHKLMKEGVFPFLRATFYRWCQLWPEVCPEAARAATALAVGDLHVENFGTWRDAEGRLVWGINDFDEAAPMPFTIDLVRLAVSAMLAAEAGHLDISPGDACDAILEGYRETIGSGGMPFVLGENHHWLRELAMSDLRDPVVYWNKLDALPEWKREIPRGAAKALEKMLPEAGLSCRVVHRSAGLGSLGRERYTAIADWRGGKIAREAKSLAVSACALSGAAGAGKIYYQEILDASVRCRDPYVRLQGRWIVRRLAPDCSRIELVSLPRQREELKLLANMGRETANIHLGSRKAIKSIKKNLGKLPAKWLHTASKAMCKATVADWNAWRNPA